MTHTQILKSLLYTSLAVAIVLLAVFVPGLSFAIFLIPVLFLTLGLRLTPMHAYIAAGFFLFVVALLFGNAQAITMGLLFALTPAAFTLYLKSNEHIEDTIMKSTIVSFAALIMSHVAIQEISGQSAAQMIAANLKRAVLNSEGALKPMMGNLSISTEELIKIATSMLPTVLFSMALAWILVLFGVALLLRKFGMVKFYTQPLATFRFRKLTIGQLLSFIFILFLGALISNNEVFLTNIISILYLVIGLEGMSVVYFFLRVKKMSPFVGGLIIIISVFIPFVQRIYGVVGLIDNVLDFRKLEHIKS
ncbi:DUF2232 domain-containing protein [Guggenheimella bovis]